MSTLPLAEKTALVTGASQSIGLATAELLAADGATVVIMGRRKEALAEAQSGLLQKVPSARIELFAGDATDESSVKAALDFSYQLNQRLDILVPTVGGGNMRPLLLRDADTVRREIDVNFISAFLILRYGAPLLPEGGSIVYISSIAAVQAFWGLGIYGASKAALERLVQAAAFELGGAKIRVNAIRPGMTMPEEVQAMPEMRGTIEAYSSETALGRIGNPMDIARVARFLAGPESGWVTGQNFSVDGGQELGKAPDHMDAFFGAEIMDQVRKGDAFDDVESQVQTQSQSLVDPQNI